MKKIIIFLLLCFSAIVSCISHAERKPSTSSSTIKALNLLNNEEYKELNELLKIHQVAYEIDHRNEGKIFDLYKAFQTTNQGVKENLNKWIELYPNSHAAYLARGSYYVHSASIARGSKFAHKTSDIEFAGMRIYHKLAESDFHKALKLNKNLIYAYGMLLRIEASGSNRDRAASLISKALAIDPYSFIIHNRIVFKLQPKWGGSSEALAQYLDNKIVPIIDKNKKLNSLLGYREYIRADRQEREGNRIAAATHYDNAVDAMNGVYHGLILKDRGVNNHFLGKRNEALEDFNKAIKVRPWYVDALASRGRLLYALDRYDEALVDFNTALALEENDEDALSYRSDLYLTLKKPTLALADINLALRFGVTDATHWGRKGLILMTGLKDNVEAVKAYNKATQLKPNKPDYWYGLGVSNFRLKNCDFIQPLKKYIELCKESTCGNEYTSWAKIAIDASIKRKYCQ